MKLPPIGVYIAPEHSARLIKFWGIYITYWVRWSNSKHYGLRIQFSWRDRRWGIRCSNYNRPMLCSEGPYFDV